MLTRASVILNDGTIDAYRLQGFQQIVELLPHFRAEEVKRQPEPRPQIVFTVPPEVELPSEARHLQRSLVTRAYDALVSADRRVLLLSPYWSDEGRDVLLPALERAISLELPIMLAGAKRDATPGHHDAMLRFGEHLGRLGAGVRVLTFIPPKKYSILHAKVVAGKYGYLGSANLTVSGLGEHVEAGLPLGEPDVEQIWWLLDVLERAGLLEEEPAI
jgi:phosphatidylserine/phosphatidylglycerophosphate/cardiolipin synthase-like enzyme